MTTYKRRKRCQHCGRQLTLTYITGGLFHHYVWAHRRGQGQRCREVQARRAAVAETEGD